MRTLIAYLFALLAVAAGIWFGFYAGADGDDGDDAAAPRSNLTPVVLAPVRKAPFADSLEALGTALANESVKLVAIRNDLVRALHFADGQEVAAGALLVELDIAEEQAMLAEAKAIEQERATTHRRQVELALQHIAPDSEVDTAAAQLAAARARVKMLEVAIEDRVVTAPFAGRLGLRQISMGAMLSPSTVIATLDDLAVVKVDFTIPETWLASVRIGLPIDARTDAYPGRVFPEKVTAIDTRLDPKTRSAMKSSCRRFRTAFLSASVNFTTRAMGSGRTMTRSTRFTTPSRRRP